MVDGPMLTGDAAGIGDALLRRARHDSAGVPLASKKSRCIKGALETNRVRLPYLWLEFYLLGYLRGPSGIRLALAEQLS
jgi:hypothetical protein